VTPFYFKKAFCALPRAIAPCAKQNLSALLILLLLVLILIILIILLILVLVVLVVLLILVLILIILHFDLRSPPNEITQPQSAEHRLFMQKANDILSFFLCSAL